MARHKRYCVAPGTGCPNAVPLKDRSEYCPEHRCQAWSTAYGECVQGKAHAGKHINNKNQEWGDGR